MVQGYRVTAVGEVPPETVRAIAQSIRTAGPAPSMSESLLGIGHSAHAVARAEASTSIFDGSPASASSASAAERHALDGGRAAFGASAGLGNPGGPVAAGAPATAAFGAASAAGPGRH